MQKSRKGNGCGKLENKTEYWMLMYRMPENAQVQRRYIHSNIKQGIQIGEGSFR